jgi:hypothetical protein
MPVPPLFDWQGRPTRPLAWVFLFGGAGVIAGSASGFSQAGWEGALVGGFVGGVIGTTIGLRASLLTRLISRLVASRRVTGYLGRSVRRPALWGWPLACAACGWQTTPEGPWRIRDCTSPPTWCPTCGNVLHRVPAAGPVCGTVCQRYVRWPKSLRRALWGGDTCAVCGCEFDKWGRDVRF